jgi:thiol-disulfide isomerase/thioredoxin/outer membrane lipoprotein-sorting protein
MRLMRFMMLGVWLVAARCALADGPDANEILKQAQAAAKALNAVSYDAMYHIDTPQGGQARDQQAKVTMGRNFPALPKIRVDASWLTGPQTGSPNIQVASDGNAICAIDHDAKQFVRQEGPQSANILLQVVGLLVGEFAGINPYAEELNAQSATYVGTEKVGEEECHVVQVELPRTQNTVRWYFSTRDYLPRRVDRSFHSPNGMINRTLRLAELKVNPTFSDDVFRLERPEGYSTPTPLAPPTQPGRTPLLAVGSEAPDWSLKTPDGKTVTLKELRGKIVMLDFWATWCGPCRLTMPTVQKLFERYKDKPVVIYGIDVWERKPGRPAADPVAFMKEKKFTYNLLLEGDAVAQAYRVTGVPTFYIIGTDGKIVYADAGVISEDTLVPVIEQALKQIK